MPRIRIACRLAVVALAVLMPAVSALADEPKPSITFNLLSVEGLVVGKSLKVDKAFAAEHGVPVPAPFSVIVPLSPAKAYETFVETAPGIGESWVKLSFATTDRQLMENVQFVPMSVAMGETQERLKAAAGALVREGLAQAFDGKARTGRDVVRAIKIGGYDAVDVIGHFDDPELGTMYVRLVGILNPDAPDSVAAVAKVVLARVPVKSVDDFARTRSGALLTQFRYLKP